MAKSPFALRIDEELLERLRKATLSSGDRYAPTMTQVVERGIELALKELERRK
jgi:hypothetical protein